MTALLLLLMITVGPGEDLHVEDAGEGPAVVMIAGLSGCTYSFRHVAPELQADGFRTIAIDPLAAGLSSRPPGAAYHLTAQSKRLAVVLDSLQVHQALVVVQGVHASTVYRLTLARPDLVRGIVSLEGGVVESAATAGVRHGLKLAKLAAKLGAKGLIRDRLAKELRRSSGDASWVDKTEVRKYYRGAMRDMGGTLDAILAMTEQPEPRPLSPRLDQLQVPVLVLLGGHHREGGLGQDDLEDLRAAVADFSVETVPGSGHFIMEENPGAVIEAVGRLNARLSVSSSPQRGSPAATGTPPAPADSDPPPWP